MTLQQNVSLAPFTTLKAGGPAELFAVAHTHDELAALAQEGYARGLRVHPLGWGSNILPSDDGVPGLTLINLATTISIDAEGQVEAECGCAFQDLFLKTAQKKWRGLEFAVGIPGTLGGALVSNAGAYRSNVSEFLTELEIVTPEGRKWVPPTWMEFEYRDSILRKPNPPQAIVLRARLKLPSGEPKAIYDEAREYQRQRIGKQPPPASAGSFFKNVNSHALAEQLPTLPQSLKNAGVVPAGFLIEAVQMKGFRFGRAMFAKRHANFMINALNATAFEIRDLAELAKRRVREQFGVTLEEEVLYFGDWSGYEPAYLQPRRS